MSVCQYFLKGTCRFGDRCRYEHPTPGRTVCQHFLRGNCRFGDMCRNEHPSGGNSSFGGRSGFSGNQSGFSRHTSPHRWQSGHGFVQPLFGSPQLGGMAIQITAARETNILSDLLGFKNRFGVLSGSENSGNTFGGQQKPISSQDAGHTPSQIQQTIQRDMDTWDMSKQWPLSCYTYSKGPCIPGLTDWSPEELRLEAYKCHAEGKSAVYQQGLSELLELHKQRRAQYRNMSVAQIHDLVVKSSEGVAEDSGFSSVFSQASQASISPVSSGTFSGMATSPQSSAFGTGISPEGSFPAQQSSRLFSGSSQTGGHLFGMATPQAPSQLFGSSSTQLGGLFGNQTKSDDGSSMATEPSGTAPESNQSVTTNVSVFSGSLNPGNTTTVQFGNAGQGSANASPRATSLISQASASALRCSDEDLAAFKAPMFTLGKIPESPPPMELC